MGGKRFNSLDTTSAFGRPGTILIIMRFLTKPICLLVADILLFGATDPRSTPSFILIVGFLLLSATIYYLLDGILAFLRLYGLAPRNRKRVLRTGTMVVCGILALQSMGQLSLRDLLILAPLTFLAYFYLAYSRDSRQPAVPAPDTP
jgi:hypothetical protein